jgi:hypothetical protein
MLETQRLAINDLYRGLKGQGTPNGSDLLTSAKTRGAVLYPLVPLDDSTANAFAYRLDAISNGVIQGNYVGFAAGDFTAQGVTGGVNKFFGMVALQNAFTINNVGVGVYCFSNIGANNNLDIGVGSSILLNSFFINSRNAADFNTTRINDSGGSLSFITTDSRGLNISQRNGSTREIVKNNAVVTADVQATSITIIRAFYAHAFNDGAGSATAHSARTLSMYMAGFKHLSANELVDFYTVIQRFQSNVITGGRQIGAAILPIS